MQLHHSCLMSKSYYLLLTFSYNETKQHRIENVFISIFPIFSSISHIARLKFSQETALAYSCLVFDTVTEIFCWHVRILKNKSNYHLLFHSLIYTVFF